ncbi:hypothetical protein BJ912DRAFT_380310 [Pholiota molesta]|nr:hypothetical protein BJ912DRAFT_380310 [Pholiota molesta]
MHAHRGIFQRCPPSGPPLPPFQSTSDFPQFQMSKIFSTIRDLTSSYSRSYTPAQDSGSIPVDGASSVNENDQQAKPHVRRSSPFTLPTTAQAGPILKTTGFPHGPPSIAAHVSETDSADLEPDEEWKGRLKARIQLGLRSLVHDAKDNRRMALRKADVTPEDRKKIDIEYKTAVASIKQLARDQYEAELEEERDQRWWTAGEVEQGRNQLAVTASSEQLTVNSHPPPQS